MMRPPFNGSVIALVVGALGIIVAATSAFAGKPAERTFRMPGDCVRRLAVSPERCADILERAWRHYMTHTPRYLRREDCRRSYRVCVVLSGERLRVNPTDGYFVPVMWFVPPLWAIHLPEGNGDSFDVLIDEDMQPLADSRRTETIAVGRFSPSVATVRANYLASLKRENTQLKGSGGTKGRQTTEPRPSLQGLGPGDSYPVAPTRLREIKNSRSLYQGDR